MLPLRTLLVLIALILPNLLAAQPALAATWNIGDVFLGVATGTYQVRAPDGTLKETFGASGGFTTGCAFDGAGNFYGTWFSTNNVFKFDGAHPHPSSSFGGGYSTPESIVFDKLGNVYVGNLGNGIRKFAPDGTFIKTVINTKVDWLDLAADQDTILYTQEGVDIKRVSESTGMSLTNFTTGTATQAFALRILSDGGVLLADRVNVKRYNALGAVVQTYTAGTENSWFSLNLDPNGTSFWAGNFNSANYYRFNITTGAVEIGPINTGTGPNTLFGICVKGEITAGGPPPAAKLILTPPAARNTVGTSHTVTATVTDANGNPSSGVVVIFSVTGANTASGQCTTGTTGQCTFSYIGTVAGVDAISAFADTNNSGKFDAGEPTGAAEKTWLPGAPATLVLAPPAATNTVGDQHCVTATVRDAFGNPTPGIIVRFTVAGAMATFSTPSSGFSTTNAAGQATFCFTAALPGANVIHAFADSNNNRTQDLGEPSGDATKTWILPVGTALCEIKITDGGHITAINGDRGSFGGVARSDAAGNASGNEEYQDHGPAQPMNVKATDILAITCTSDFKTAMVYGTATIDGSGSYAFRIRMTDNGEPGTADVYGIILSNGYNSGDKILEGGNIQIHKL